MGSFWFRAGKKTNFSFQCFAASQRMLGVMLFCALFIVLPVYFVRRLKRKLEKKIVAARAEDAPTGDLREDMLSQRMIHRLDDEIDDKIESCATTLSQSFLLSFLFLVLLVLFLTFTASCSNVWRMRAGISWPGCHGGGTQTR